MLRMLRASCCSRPRTLDGVDVGLVVRLLHPVRRALALQCVHGAHLPPHHTPLASLPF